MTAPEFPAVQSLSGLTVRQEADRATVHRAMDAIRASGTPRSQAQLTSETGLCNRTISKYSRNYVRGINAELLDREVRDEGAFQAWMALYRSFAGCVRASPEARTVQTRLLRLVIESLDRTGRPVTHNAVRAFTNVGLTLPPEMPPF